MSLPKLRPQKGRGSPLLGALVFALTLLVSAYFWFEYSASMQKKSVLRLDRLASRLGTGQVPLKISILSTQCGEIRSRLQIYDLSGREIAVMEKAWPGTELDIDMLLIPASSESGSGPRATRGAVPKTDFWLAFPCRIFTDKLGAASGTLLFDAYVGQGFPEVLGGIPWSGKELASLTAAFGAARRRAAALPSRDSATRAFGSAAHEVVRLSRFEIGAVYKVVCRSIGGLEILRD